MSIVLESGIDSYVYSHGKKYSYFGGNNYLGLAGHTKVKEAAVRSVKKYGVNFSASRCTTGTASVHLELEKQLSLFKGKQDTVVYASGFLGNRILLEILKDTYSVVFTDEYAHASIFAGIPGDMKVLYYNHCDADHLDNLLDQHMITDPLIITDGVFALSGEIAPLDKIYPVVKKYNGILVVDDAHSTGILGKTGRGTPEHFNLPEDGNIYQTETMSKALGSYGGFISGDNNLTGMIRTRSSTYLASTALPPPVVAAGIASLKVMHDNPDLHINLLGKSARLREEINGLGFQTTKDNTPIIPIILKDYDKAKSLSLFLEENGIIVPFMNYPSRQEINLVRITITTCHKNHQIESLLELLKKWKRIRSAKY
jgi:7-keto-8-aminopelargonate synthetase-like enzyme